MKIAIRPFALLVILLFLPHISNAQDQQNSSSELMSNLSFLEGKWFGFGWHDHGNSEVNHFEQTLTVKSQMDGEVLIAESKALQLPSKERVLHHSVTVYRFDAESQGLVANAVLKNGKLRQKSIVVGQDSISWSGRSEDEKWELFILENGQLRQRAVDLRSGEIFFELTFEER